MGAAMAARMSRILEVGPGAVSDVELVAAVLAGTGRRERPEAVAARLLEGGLLRLRRMPACEVLRESRVRPAQAARLVAALELGRRAMAAALRQRERFLSPRACGRSSPISRTRSSGRS